jgi:D-inositol-3-phosphate glycosyltransferase
VSGRPRAVIVMHYVPPHIGGMETVAASQAESLTERGYDVTVLTCRHSRTVPLRSDGGGYRVLRTPTLNVVESRFGVTFPIVSPLFLLRALRAFRGAEIVHLHDVFYTTSHLAALAALLLRKPIYLTQHVAMVDHPSRLVMAVQRLVYGLAGRPIFRRAKAIIVYNTNVRDHLLAQGVPADKVVLTHNGIDTTRFTPADADDKRKLRERHGLPTDRPLALFVGRMVPKKGADLVVAAASAAHTTLLVGEGEVTTTGPGVIAFGPARGEDLVDLYRAADVFVFPAIGEIFTLVMQEAMACGLPVITYDDPGYANYDLDRTRVSLVPRDAASLRHEIDTLLADPDRLAAMASYSRELATERFSWAANYPAQHAVYADATPTRRR